MNRWPFHVWIYLGFLLLLLGVQVGMVEVFVFSPQATQNLRNWFGFGGAGSSFSLGQGGYQGHFRPANWVGYALLSAGAVLFMHGWLLRRSRG